MKLTSVQARKLLDDSRGMASDDHWIEHSLCVGYIASVLATELKLDADYAMVLGYVHDIGKRFGWETSHALTGYRYLKDLGYEEEASVCLTHSFLNNDINCVAGGYTKARGEDYNFLKNYVENHNYTIYDKLINLSDLLCKQRPMLLEQRLIEIISRRGAFDNTKYHVNEAMKLKAWFDEQIGYNLYDLFSEIKDNL